MIPLISILLTVLVASLAFGQEPVADGPAFVVNARPDSASNHAVGMAADGSFVVVWAEDLPDPTEGPYYDAGVVFARRFDVDGVPVGDRVRITNPGEEPDIWGGIAGSIDVAVTPTGRFMVRWTGVERGPNQVTQVSRARLYGRSGQFVADVSDASTEIAPHGASGFVGASRGSSGELFVTRYGSGGNVVAGPVRVEGTSANYLDVSACPDGRFLVAWGETGGQSWERGEVYGRLYDGSMASLTDTSLISDNGPWLAPAVACDSNGTFQIAWAQSVYDGTAWIRGTAARRYDADGTAVGPEFWVDVADELGEGGDAAVPTVASDAPDHFLTLWSSSIEWAISPQVASNGNGRSVVIWYDQIERRLVGQRLLVPMPSAFASMAAASPSPGSTPLDRCLGKWVTIVLPGVVGTRHEAKDDTEGLDFRIDSDLGHDDFIRGTPGDDVINSGRGNDTIYGYGGNDRICGGPGDDVIRAGAGDDFVKAGSGNDDVGGQYGNDVLRGNEGSDRLHGGPGSDDLYGGGGKNSCVAGERLYDCSR